MAKYQINLIIESDDDYSDSEQIEELINDIEMTVAGYNCFYQNGDIKICELN